MDILKDTPLELGTMISQLTPNEPSLLAVTKATYDIAPGGELTLAEAQRPPSGDAYDDDDPERSLRDASDFALLKPRGECLVMGSAHAADGRFVPRLRAGFRVGDVRCDFEVVGDRRWESGWVGRRPSSPTPFSKMPLAWERAFGGAAYADNPVGCGLSESGPLPNLERVDEPMLAPGDRLRPICPAPIAPSWAPRQRRTGTYDRRWHKDRFPWLAADFDVRFFMASAREQWARGYFRGDELIELEGLHPEAWRVRTRVPRIAPRVFVCGEGRFEEVGLVLDTLVIDADAGQLMMTWRGLVRVADAEASDVRSLRVVHEDSEARRPAAAYRPEPPRSVSRPPVPQPLAFHPPPAPAAPPLPDELRARPRPDDAPASGAARPRDERPVYGPELPTEAEQEAHLDAEIDRLRVLMAELGVEVPAESGPPTEAHRPNLGALRGLLAEVDFLEPGQVDELLAGLEPEAESPPEDVPPTPTEPSPAAEPEPTLVTARERVASVHAAGEPLEGDFQGANLADLPLPHLVARGVDLRGACLDRCDLRGADLRGSILEGATLRGAQLEGAQLDGADLDRAQLDGATLMKASLEDASLERASLREVDARQAKLARAELCEADLRDARLSGAVLDEASLREANLSGADLSRASLVEARLHGAKAWRAVFWRARMEGCRIADDARLDEADLREVAGTGARLRDSSFVGACFDGSVLRRADFGGSDLSNARLIGVDLRHARLVEARLRGAVLEGSDLMDAVLQRADLGGADLRRASLYGAELFEARTQSARFPRRGGRS